MCYALWIVQSFVSVSRADSPPAPSINHSLRIYAVCTKPTWDLTVVDTHRRYFPRRNMFRVTPWKSYIPITTIGDPPSLLQDNHHGHYDTMDEDIDMDAPQISILQDDKTPPPQPKFKVKLLVGNKKRSASQALPDDDRGEDEEDELIDDDEEVPQPADPQPAAPPPPPSAPPKRASRSKASKAGTSASRRKPKAQPADAAQDLTWVDPPQPDSEGKPSKAALDNTDSASVASASTTKKPTKTRTRKPPAK